MEGYMIWWSNQSKKAKQTYSNDFGYYRAPEDLSEAEIEHIWKTETQEDPRTNKTWQTYDFLITYHNGNKMKYNCRESSIKNAFKSSTSNLGVGDSIMLISIS